MGKKTKHERWRDRFLVAEDRGFVFVKKRCVSVINNEYPRHLLIHVISNENISNIDAK